MTHDNEALKKTAEFHNARQPGTYARGIGEVVGTLVGLTVGVTAVLGTLGGCLYALRWIWRGLVP